MRHVRLATMIHNKHARILSWGHMPATVVCVGPDFAAAAVVTGALVLALTLLHGSDATPVSMCGIVHKTP